MSKNVQTKEGSIEDIGKGVEYYAYLDANGTFSVSFNRPHDWGEKTQPYPMNNPDVMQYGKTQIQEHDISIHDHYGKFWWVANQGDTELSTQDACIAPSDGGMSNDSSMYNMLDTTSIFGTGWALSYGFYDSGPGDFGLTNHDQSYVCVTRDMSNWMAELATEMGSTLTGKPFSVFAIPGAHDSGTFDTKQVKEILNSAEAEIDTFLDELIMVLANKVSKNFIKPIATEYLLNLSVTQKDNITDQLNLGTRYFDFRPGYCYQKLLEGIYHQHNFVPGYPYQSFLEDILNWLNAHNGEIVVVNLNLQGFNSPDMEPDPQTLKNMFAAAQTATQTTETIVAGNENDLNTSYAELLSSNKRLIFLNLINQDNEPTKYDSYDKDTYTTTDVTNIINALKGMSTDGQANANWTILQLQGTASGIPGIWAPGIGMKLNYASSPLMSTKPGFDNQTYPWLLQNVTANLKHDQLVVFLNDFVDNALAAYAVEITTERANALTGTT